MLGSGRLLGGIVVPGIFSGMMLRDLAVARRGAVSAVPERA